MLLLLCKRILEYLLPAVPDIPLGPVIRGYEESAFVNFLEQSHDAAGGWPRYGGPPAAG